MLSNTVKFLLMQTILFWHQRNFSHSYKFSSLALLYEMLFTLERNPPSPGWPGDRLRWRKEQMAYRPSSELPERPRAEIETDAHIEGNLATEISFIILDTLERIVQVKVLLKVHCSDSYVALETFLLFLHHLIIIIFISWLYNIN